MKRIVSIVVGAMFSLLCVASGQDVEKQTSDVQQKCVKADSAVCGKKTTKFSKRAAYYQDKAAGEKNKDLAAIYSKCAEAKKKMADGHAKMNKSYKECECKTILSSNPEIKSEVFDGKMKNCMMERKKGVHLSTRVKNMQGCADMCLKKAQQTEDKNLAQQYNKIAACMQAKSEGLNLVMEGKKEFKDARKELKVLKAKAKAAAKDKTAAEVSPE